MKSINNEKLMKKIALRFSTTIIHHSLLIIHFACGIQIIQSLYKNCRRLMKKKICKKLAIVF